MVVSNPLDELSVKNEKYVKSCTELYMANKQITKIDNFERFVNLEILWLNSNNIRDLVGLDNCFRIKELYIQGNNISSLKGSSVACFHFLKILRMSDNNLSDLHSTLQHLSKLHQLIELDLFKNPLAEESNYRAHVINTLPSLEIFDRHKVTIKEKDEARKIVAKNSSIRKNSSRSRDLPKNVTSLSCTEKMLMNEVQNIGIDSKLRKEKTKEILVNQALQRSTGERCVPYLESSSKLTQQSINGLTQRELYQLKALWQKSDPKMTGLIDVQQFVKNVLEGMKDFGKLLTFKTINSDKNDKNHSPLKNKFIHLTTDSGLISWEKLTCSREENNEEATLFWSNMTENDLKIRANTMFSSAKILQHKAMMLSDKDAEKTAILREVYDLSIRANRLENLGHMSSHAISKQLTHDSSMVEEKNFEQSSIRKDIFTLEEYKHVKKKSHTKIRSKTAKCTSSPEMIFDPKHKDFQIYLKVNKQKKLTCVKKKTYQL